MTEWKNPTPFPLVHVAWLDPTYPEGAWTGEDEIEEWAEEAVLTPVQTVGWLIRSTENYIVVAADYDQHGRAFSGVTAIPNSIAVVTVLCATNTNCVQLV